jgi:DNA topoisomerase-1
MNLIIVESPTKARTLSRFLGNDYSVEATMGHIKDLPKSKLGVDIEKNFEPEYLVVDKRNKEIKKLRKEAKKAAIIYLATDPDREGEAIAAHVREVLSDQQSTIDNQQLKRIVFHEITKNAVEEAIKNPRKIDKNLVGAQIARRVLDRLVGYKLSPLLWKKVRRGLSAGRVQSVTVRLIVEREREIEAFKPDEYWEIFCEVISTKSKAKSEKFIVKLIKIGDKKVDIGNGKTAKSVVSDLEKSNYKVFDVRKREVSKKPYPPFTTSTVTQTAARFFGWSAKRTMAVAQKLYEEGLITYHRTDSTNISKSALTKVRAFIKKRYGDDYLPEKSRLYKTKAKVAQEAHEAIRPTKVGMTNEDFQISDGKFIKDAKLLYDVIWKRFVACQMADSVYDETRIDVSALRQFQPKADRQGKQLKYTLRASGQIMKFDGWRKVLQSRIGQEDKPQLPEVSSGDPLQLVKVLPEQKFTQPPPRFNEASLIKTLEKLGIGRPSTYAPIITTIQLRQYVEKDEGKFTPTPVGIAVNDFLIKNFPNVFEYSFTAGMEDDLDSVANGKKRWEGMMKQFYNPFDKKLLGVEKKAQRVAIETEKLGKRCPKCKKGELVIRLGRFGKFVSCSKFPDCDYKDRYVEKLGMKCPECKKGDVVIKKTGKGRKFYGCSRYPDCNWASWKKPEKLSS